ncbi:phosphatase PAP2 family protein [Spiroplasma gladiatoris]|uniref:Phosphatase PAP2 family protein n=1 Tax=Spiroplasma gladiatoris TaxID=2143 RepID=A0A4P7AK56_9MOLU|nr:phosphatase PAP2 family protein [Spiroplasma gladiatoris]QBQ08143.1 phosphatase PAP2 family protein [Spiroplasma gladiatoris]
MFDINKKSREYKFLFVPGVIIASISCVTFLLSGVYDQEIDDFFKDGIDYIPVKIFTVFMEEFGTYSLLCLLFLFLGVIWETLYFYQINYSKKNFVKNNKWLVYIYYLISLCIWIITIYTSIVEGFKKDFGFGPGNDPYSLADLNYRVYALIVIKILELGVMLAGFIFLRFKLSKRKDILTNEYWMDSLKGISYIAFMYMVVGAGKTFFGRPYPYSVNFDEILRKTEEKGWTYTPETGYFGTGIDGRENATYFPWWKPNDFFGNIKYWFDFNAHQKDNNGWWNRDFPSGHTTSVCGMTSIMFYFIGPNKKRNLKWYKIFYIYMIIGFLLPTMQMSLILQRTHWASDLEFSNIIALSFIPLANYFVNRHVRYWKNKWNAKHFEKFSGFIKEQKNGFKVYVNTTYGYIVICKFYYGKNKQAKIEKIINKYNINIEKSIN